MKFLGHLISSKGTATDPENICRVAKWPVPLNRWELQQFLGFIKC